MGMDDVHGDTDTDDATGINDFIVITFNLDCYKLIGSHLSCTNENITIAG